MKVPNPEIARVLVGRILKPHGVHGVVRVESYMIKPEMIAAIAALENEAGQSIRLSLESAARGTLLARIEGVTTRDEAQALSGHELYALRSSFPAPGEDVLYEADIVGLSVVEVGRTRGRVVAVADFGAGPLLEVAPADGRETVYVPFSHPTVTEIDLKCGIVCVNLPAGLWPED